MTMEELTQCVDAYGKDIYSFCRYLCRNTAEGEELYQETFLKAVELAEKIDMQNNPKSFLISISMRLWRNRYRKLNRQKMYTNPQGVQLMNENGHELPDTMLRSPEEQCLDQELHTLVSHLVQSLPDHYRIPICMYYSAELSIMEISKILKTPEGTIKRRLYHARKLLKKELEGAGYEA